MKSYKTLKAKMDKMFSLYIRTRDSDENGMIKCCTCDVVKPIKEMHCGHFMSRRYLYTRWHEQNCAGQCPSCNTFNNGRQYEFGKYIDKRWAIGIAAALFARRGIQIKYSRSDLSQMIEETESKLMAL